MAKSLFRKHKSNVSREDHDAYLAVFERLFRSYFPQLKRYAYNILNSEQLADDAVQNVFERLWKERQRIEFGKAIQGYLFQCTHSRCLDILRKEKKDDTFTELFSHEDSIASTPSFSESDYRELETQLLSAINQLPPKNKTVFELNRFSGMQYKEIAEELGISVKAVEARMSKALKILRSETSHLISIASPFLLLLFF